jgi:hypothetical protein
MKQPTKKQTAKFCRARGIPLQIWSLWISRGDITLNDFHELVRSHDDPANSEYAEEMAYEMAANRF